jgi:hypothetical protein
VRHAGGKHDEVSGLDIVKLVRDLDVQDALEAALAAATLVSAQ